MRVRNLADFCLRAGALGLLGMFVLALLVSIWLYRLNAKKIDVQRVVSLEISRP